MDFNLEKYKTISQNNKSVFLYDNTCELCINATQFASKLLKNKNIDSMLFGIKKEFKREILSSDSFMFFYNGECYKSHEGWIKIFSLLNFPWNLAKYISKNKYCLRIVEKLYNIISNNRKKFKLFRKKDCNCD